jgi:DNA-binding protein HU-beta
MNKSTLIGKIAGCSHITRSQASSAVETFIDSITAALKKGERVTFVGFGTFAVSQRKARTGRNPQTGAEIKIAAKRVAKFTPGIDLKKAVNKK